MMDPISSLLTTTTWLLGSMLWRDIKLTRTREARAAHEAGHALLMWRSPSITRFVRASIAPGWETGGVTEAVRREIPTVAGAFDAAVIAMGGAAGELVACGEFDPAHAGSDVRQGREALGMFLPAPQVEAALARALRTAAQKLAAEQAAFDRLRTALDNHVTIGEIEMKAVVGPR